MYDIHTYIHIFVGSRLEDELEEQQEAHRVSLKVEEGLRAECQMLTNKLAQEKREKNKLEKSEAALKLQVDMLTSAHRGVAVVLKKMISGMTLKVCLRVYLWYVCACAV
jgi:hypothetical protein